MLFNGTLRPMRLDLGPERLGLRPERPDLRPERPDLRPERLDLSPERLEKLRRGGTYGRTDVRTDGRKEIHPCVLQDIRPLGPLPSSHSTSSVDQCHNLFFGQRLQRADVL